MKRRFCTMKKLLAALTVIGALALVTLIASCINEQQPVTQSVYRGAIPDSIYMRMQDLEHIADYLKRKEQTASESKELSQALLGISGTLILLLLGGLMWFLKLMLVSIPKLQVDVNKLNTTIAASEQWNKDQKDSCVERHKDLNQRLNKLER